MIELALFLIGKQLRRIFAALGRVGDNGWTVMPLVHGMVLCHECGPVENGTKDEQ